MRVVATGWPRAQWLGTAVSRPCRWVYLSGETRGHLRRFLARDRGRLGSWLMSPTFKASCSFGASLMHANAMRLGLIGLSWWVGYVIIGLCIQTHLCYSREHSPPTP